MPGYIEDRWMTKRPDPATGKKRRTERWGKGKRYRVAGIPGVKDASFTVLEDAKKWLAKAQTDSGRGTFVDPREGTVTLREYVEKHWWPSTRIPPSTREAMEHRIWGHILPHLGELPLRGIGTDQLNAWVVKVEPVIGPNTVRACWRHLSSILQAAVEAKRIPANPCRGMSTARPPARPKQKARAWAADTVSAVRAGLPDRYQVLADLGVGVGVRQGEAFGLSPEDFADGQVHVQRQVMRIKSRLCFGPPKGNKDRKIPTPEALLERIERYQKDFPVVEVTLPWVDPDLPNLPWEQRPLITVPLLVTTSRRGGVNRTNWNEDVWKAALGSAGLILPLELDAEELAKRRARRASPVKWPEAREFGFHALRHTYASVQLHAGESIVALAAWLGHSDPAFTLRTYTHFMPESGTRGVAAMDAWLRGSIE